MPYQSKVTQLEQAVFEGAEEGLAWCASKLELGYPVSLRLNKAGETVITVWGWRKSQ